MLIDIFSSFDEQNGNFLGIGALVWVGGLLGSFLFFSSYWWGVNRVICLSDLVKSFVGEHVLRGRGTHLGGFRGIVAVLFIMLLSINLSGLVPYVFRNTRHLLVTFRLSTVLWLSLLLRGLFFNLGSFLAVLLPVGAPSLLTPFLILVETVRLLVRPVTLAVRLAANIGAGHIVLCLLGGYLSSGFFSYSSVSILLMITVGVFYFMFEVGICLIQSYIFFLLLNLYGDEHR